MNEYDKRYYFSEDLVRRAGMEVEYVMDLMVKEYGASVSPESDFIWNKFDRLRWYDNKDRLRAKEWFDALELSVKLSDPEYAVDRTTDMLRYYARRQFFKMEKGLIINELI